jgi:hypothetical protein
MVPAIDKVAHEDVTGIGNLTSDSQELEQIPKLAVDVSADSHGRRHRLDVRLLHEDLPYARTE